MTVYSKFNIVYRLQKWLDSVPGQTFLNYAYSWGASIVILGTLFKLTHLPGANIMLYLGMGTEVIVFFISAFDRPFDKTADGKDLPTHAFADEAAQGEEGEPLPGGAEAPAAGASAQAARPGSKTRSRRSRSVFRRVSQARRGAFLSVPIHFPCHQYKSLGFSRQYPAAEHIYSHEGVSVWKFSAASARWCGDGRRW